jgi:hypothetical protein
MDQSLSVLYHLLPYIGLGGAATALTQIIKRGASLEKSWVIRGLFHAITVAATAVSFLLGSHGLSALAIFLHGGAVGGFGNALYPVVKWLDKWVTRVGKALKVVEADETKVTDTVDKVAAEAPIAAAEAAPEATVTTSSDF